MELSATTTIDCNRIQEYAKKLRSEGTLEYWTLSKLARNLNNEFNKLKGQKRGKLKERDLNITPELIAHLQQKFSEYFNEKFWLEKAEFILQGLEQWKAKGIILTKPEISLRLSADLHKDETTVELSLKELCAAESASDLLASIIAQQSLRDEFLNLLEVATKPIPITEPRLFINSSITSIPTPAILASGLQAQLRKDLWFESNGLAVFQHKCQVQSDNYIEHYISNPGDIELLPWEAAEQIINKFGFTSAKLHLIYAAHTMKQVNPWESDFTLKATDIIKELGWDKRTDLSQAHKLNEIAKAAFVLSCFVSRAFWIEGRTKNKVNVSCPTGRTWDSVIEPCGTADIFTRQIEQPYEVFITVRPGLWTKHFLNRAGAKAKQALYQFGYLAQKVLQIDPDELALRLALHLTMESRYHQSGRYEVKTLLKMALPETELETARSDKRKAYELKQRWDNALKLLISLDWQIQYDLESYPAWLQPGTQGKKRMPKGYIDKLLAAKITIFQPTPIPDLIAIKAEPQNLKLNNPDRKALLTADKLRKAREAKGWNQSQLAAWLGVSQQLISHIERGKRPITPQLEKKFRKVLDLQD